MVRVIACIKHSYDVQQLRYDPLTRRPMLQSAPRTLSDVDKAVVEEALRIRERYGGSVAVLTVGDEDAANSIRYAYAMGVDDGYLVLARNYEELDTGTVAEALAVAIAKVGNYDLILCGSESVDVGSGQVPVRLAVRLNVPLLGYAKSITIDGGIVRAVCDYGDGDYEYEAPMPIVAALLPGVIEPRIPTPLAIIRASRKPITTWSIDELGVKPHDTLRVVESYMPTVERKRIIIDARDESKIPEAVDKLIEALRREGLI